MQQLQLEMQHAFFLLDKLHQLQDQGHDWVSVIQTHSYTAGVMGILVLQALLFLVTGTP
jgi:hypothetical protein